jgi:hypothetical protein
MEIPKTKNFFQTFWGGVVIVLLIIGLIYFLYNFLTNKGINFLIQGPDTVKSGEIIDLHLVYANNSRIVFESGEIEIRLPQGVISIEDPEKEILNFYLGEIPARDSQDKIVKLLVTGEPKSTKSIQAVFRYKPKSLTSTFEISKGINILIFGSNFNLGVNLPKEVFVDQSFPLELSWENLTDNNFDNVEIQAVWPEGFNFIEANPSPSISGEKSNWSLGTVTGHASGKIKISGLQQGESGQTKKISFIIGFKKGDEFLPIGKAEGFLTLTSNPLEISTLINGEKNYIASLGDTLKVTIRFKNNYSTPLRNLVLKTILNGELIDFSSLKAPKALFSLRERTLIWDGLKVQELYSLSPGETSELSFTVKLLNNWPMVSFAQKNPIIEIKTTLESSNVPEGAPVAELPRAVSINSIKVNTQCELEITSYFRDASSGIANQGKLPLKVDEPTDFTIHFKILNNYNNVNNVKIRTSLPLGVEFTSQIAGNYGENLPQYDKNTRQFVWEVPNVSSGSGYLIKAPELIFQVRVTPQFSQINQPIALINETTMTAVDAFTLEEIQKTYPPVYTNKLTDKTVFPQEGIVQP